MDCIVQFQKISILPLQKGLEFPGGWGVLEGQKLKKCMSLKWNFQRGGEVLEKISYVGGGLRSNPFRERGMDIF